MNRKLQKGDVAALGISDYRDNNIATYDFPVERAFGSVEFAGYEKIDPGTTAIVLDAIQRTPSGPRFLSLMLSDGRIVRTRAAPWEKVS